MYQSSAVQPRIDKKKPAHLPHPHRVWIIILVGVKDMTREFSVIIEKDEEGY
jgi:hypothetical protein